MNEYIDFMKNKWIYFLISGVLVSGALTSLVLWGLRPSIDFTGGALLEVSFHNPTDKVSSYTITEAVGQLDGINVSSVQEVRETNSYVVRLNSIDETQKNNVLDKIKKEVGDSEEIRFETVGPTLGRELLIRTTVAVVVAATLILMYVAYQFKASIYGVSAILAMFHDTIILIGSFAIFGHLYGVEVDTLFVTAVLTTLSFSVHDTIVVFDRVREATRLNLRYKPVDVINKSVTETLSRSINNSMTIIFMLTALAFLGGVTIRWFVVALLIGTIIGTYSSTFVAAPLLLLFMNRKKD